jgi:hypothetical protein
MAETAFGETLISAVPPDIKHYVFPVSISLQNQSTDPLFNMTVSTHEIFRKFVSHSPALCLLPSLCIKLLKETIQSAR